MKIYSRLLALALLAAAPMISSAAPVAPQDAERVARHFWNMHRSKEVAALTAPMQRLDVRWDAFYLFAPGEGKGFVIVAADDRLQPVLAYSFHNIAMGDSVGPEMGWWLDGWQQQVDALRTTDGKASAEVEARWSALRAGKGDSTDLTVVAPMLTTQWDQDTPYNDSCPSQSSWGWWSSRAATGCVATAMAQVMKFWNYPLHGIGTHTYYSPSITGYGQGFGTQTVDFGATTYDWDNMPNQLTSRSSTAQKRAVAILMYHCGVACDMMYGTALEGGSGAYIHSIPLLNWGNALEGMIRYFGYSSNATGINRAPYDDSTWTALVRAELNAGRPILYAGGDEISGGHCFVCDGYDEQNRYHFNWGWSGEGDGYYTLSNLAPGVGGTGGGTGTYNFSANQQILIGLQPHGETDSLCIIRQYPYQQNFETSPTCWSASSTNDNSYSWMVSDTAGVDGTYSACVAQTLSGNSDDHLFSPSIIDSGNFKVTWRVRAVNASHTDSYTLSVDTLLFSETVSSTDWTVREAFFSVATDDTVQLDFGHASTRTSGGVIIDSIVIEKLSSDPVGIDPSALATLAAPLVYPNPTRGTLHIVNSDVPLRGAELFDMTGRRILTVSQLPATDSQLDLGALPSGIYLLRLTTPSGISLQKVVKE